MGKTASRAIAAAYTLTCAFDVAMGFTLNLETTHWAAASPTVRAEVDALTLVGAKPMSATCALLRLTYNMQFGRTTHILEIAFARFKARVRLIARCAGARCSRLARTQASNDRKPDEGRPWERPVHPPTP